MLRAPSADLIDLIYDAAAEPQLWDCVLTEIADMLSSTCGALCGYADQNLQGASHYFGRIDYEFAARHGFGLAATSRARRNVGRDHALAESRRSHAGIENLRWMPC
jgi:hypothetical protein